MVTNNLKKIISLVVMSVMLLSILAACVSQTPAKTETSASTVVNTQAPTEAPDPVSMRFTCYGDWYASKACGDLAVKKIKDKFNVDFIYEPIPKTAYDEKINVMWAAGDMPEVLQLMDMTKAREAVDNKVFLPVTDMIKNHADWQTVNPSFLDSGTYNDEIYGIPSNYNIPFVIYYRVDWMNKLGMKIPTNADEFYQLLYAYAKNDPDGNGKDDTYGFTIRGDFSDIWPIWVLFLPNNGPGLYLDEKESVFKNSVYLADDMKTALGWFNKAYVEGVLDKEWVLDNKTTSEDKFVTGKTGTWVKQPQWIIPRSEKMKAANPQAEMMTLPPMNGKYGLNYMSSTTIIDLVYLTKTCRDVERGKQVLGYIFSKESQTERAIGFEGITYKVEGGKLNWLDEDAMKLYNPGSFVSSVFDLKLPVPEPLLEQSMNSIKQAVYFKGTETITAKSEALKSKGADLNKLLNEYVAKIIIGELPVSKYDEMLEQYKKIGGDEVLNEVNKLYKEQ